MLPEKAKHLKRHSSSSQFSPRSPLGILFGGSSSEQPSSSSTSPSSSSSSSKSSSGGTQSSQNPANGGGSTGSGTTGTTTNGGNNGGGGRENPNGGSSSGESTNGGLNGGESSSNGGSSGNQPPNNSPAQHTFTSSSSSFAPTSTSSIVPSSTMTSSMSTSSMTSMPLPTSTSSSALPSSTHVTSVTSNGQVVIVTNTIPGIPIATSPPSSAPSPSGEQSSGPNVGAIIGGLAGGLVGLIVLIWLILLPVRARAKRKQEVDWLSFRPDNHDVVDDVQTDSIFRTPRAGVGEEDEETAMKRVNSNAGLMSTGEAYQMQDVGQGGMTLYSHLDGNPRQQWQVGQIATQHGNGMEYMNTQTGYDPNYHGYYNANYPSNTPAGFNMYSPHTSPEMGPAVYRGGGGSVGHTGQGMSGQPSPYSSPNEQPYQNYNYPNVPPIVAPVAQRPNPRSQSNPSLNTSPSSEPISSRANELSRNASGTATAVSHGGGENRSRRTPENSVPPNPMHKQASSSSVTSPVIQRRDSGKLNQTNKSEEDVCLPYDRESVSRSADSIQQQKNLHLVNPDDD